VPVATKDLEDLIARVEGTPGWTVARLGTRWRITNQEGGGPLFVSFRPPKGNTLQPILTELAKRGWNALDADAAAANKKAEAIAADRAKNDDALRSARRKMLDTDLRSLQDEVATQRNDESIKTRADRAKAFIVFGVNKEITEVDAGLAKDLLAHNDFFKHPAKGAPSGISASRMTNRPVDQVLVNTYRNAMLRGEWGLSHQGLALDTDMRLIDGQHRLLAVIEADKIQPGITFVTEITYNLDPDTYKIVDAGKKRTTGDVLANHQIPNRIVAASAAKLLHLFYNVPFPQWDKYPMTAAQTVESYEFFDSLDYPGQLAEAVRIGSAMLDVVSTRSGPVAGYYVTKRAYPGANMDEFLHGLRTGENLSPGDPRLALLRFNTRMRSLRRRVVSNVEQFALFVKTWNAYVSGQSVQQIVWRSNEPFPTPIHQGKAADYAAEEGTE
jgi:hypothetical protein